MLGISAGVADRLARVREEIASAAVRAGRDPAEVTLVGVSKTQPAEAVAEAVRAGLAHAGENRVQEARPKITRVAELLRAEGMRPPTWHMVGHLQTNKVAAAIDFFQVIESVDSLHLAAELSKRMVARGGQNAPLPILLETYLGDDDARPGFRPDALIQEAGRVAALPGLVVQGLMTVAPLGWDERATRTAFARLRDLRDTLVEAHPGVHWHTLSMGMSDDFPLAIEEGSTLVRIGRAIFGERPPG